MSGVLHCIDTHCMYLFAVRVDEALYVHTDGTGALIEDGKLGLMVKQPCHL